MNRTACVLLSALLAFMPRVSAARPSDAPGDSLPALRRAAEDLIAKKRLVEAEGIFRRILRGAPADIGAAMRLGDLYGWTGEYDRAVGLYREILEQDPLNIAALRGMARVLRWATRYTEAEGYYARALRAEPGDIESLTGMALTCAQQRNFDRALGYIDRAAEASPGNPDVLLTRGDILAWGNRFAAAESSYRQALRLRPESAETYRSMGDLYRWWGRYLRAVDVLREARRLDPKNPDVIADLAGASLDAGLVREAEESLRELFALDPASARGHEILRQLDAQSSPGYAELVNAYGKPGFLILSNVVIGLYFWRRRDRLNARGRRIMKWFYRVWPLLAAAWIALFLASGTVGAWRGAVLAEIAEFATLAVWMIAFVTLVWLTRASHVPAVRTVLAIGAHPDDVELGCGGTLSRYKEMGYRVYALVITSGEAGNPYGNERIDRRREAEEGAAILGLDGIWVHAFPDASLGAQITEIKNVIEERIRETQAEIIITQSPYDVHQDHRAVFEATKIAARGNRTILCYEDVSSEASFVANYFVDITGYLEDKIAAVRAHRTQRSKPYMDPGSIGGRAAHRGLQSGVRHAEAFVLYRGCDLWLSS